MSTRREFLGVTTAAGSLLLGGTVSVVPAAEESPVRPIVLSTWKHGLAANDSAWKILSAGGRALDAVEAGVRVSEADPEVTSVGLGGRPDRDGRVTLDACIMDETGQAGSVAYLQHIKHPISVARRVMEKTRQVMLVGDGALQFALDQGFPQEELLTDASRQAWEQWKAEQPPKNQTPAAQSPESKPAVDCENHDTIGMIALDQQRRLSGACTTSGLAWKLPGRVGDSPIIGAGLYVDNDIGAATATGVGEAVIRAVGCFLIVELMRQGRSPQEACELAIERVAQKSPRWREFQVGFLALDKAGRVGAYSLQNTFEYALCEGKQGNRLLKSASRLP